MTGSSLQVFVVVDPVHDYEDSMEILGVYGSLAEAQAATDRCRQQVTVVNGRDWPRVEPWRDVEVQLWQGDQILDVWTHSGDLTGHPGCWTHTPARP